MGSVWLLVGEAPEPIQSKHMRFHTAGSMLPLFVIYITWLLEGNSEDSQVIYVCLWKSLDSFLTTNFVISYISLGLILRWSFFLCTQVWRVEEGNEGLMNIPQEVDHWALTLQRGFGTRPQIFLRTCCISYFLKKKDFSFNSKKKCGYCDSVWSVLPWWL